MSKSSSSSSSSSSTKTHVSVPPRVIAEADIILKQTLNETYKTNIVCTAQLGSRCPIRLVAWQMHGNFVRNRFPSVIGNSSDGAWTVFERGYLRSAGADTREKAQLIIYQLMWRMHIELGVPFGIFNFDVHNNVLATQLPYMVNLRKLHAMNQAYYSYEADKFPGVIVRPSEQKLAMSIFSSGKVNIAGAALVHDGVMALRKVESALRKCAIYVHAVPDKAKWLDVKIEQVQELIKRVPSDIRVLRFESVERKIKKNDRARRESQKKRKRDAAQSNEGPSAKRQRRASHVTHDGKDAASADDGKDELDAAKLLVLFHGPQSEEEEKEGVDKSAERQGLVHLLTLSELHAPRTYEYEWLRNGTVLVMDADNAEQSEEAMQLFLRFMQPQK